MEINVNLRNPIFIFIFIALALPRSLMAGGLEFPDLGTVALGRGGAFTARADNASAFYYNPAGLAKSHGRDLLLSVHLTHLNVEYQRRGTGQYWLESVGNELVDTCPPQSICIGDPALDYSQPPPPSEFQKVSMNKLGPLPVMVFNWGNFLGVNGLAISAGVIPPSSFGSHDYSPTGAQRYALVDANHLTLFPGIGVAYRINRYLQLGAVFLSGFGHFEQGLMIRPLPSLASPTMNEGHGGDAYLKVDATDPFIPSGIIGVLSQPTEWLEIGVSLKLPAYIHADGTLSYNAPTQDMSESYMESGRDKVSLKQHFPLVIRAGLRYIHRRFDAELDVVWENWSSLQEFEIITDAYISDPINESTVTHTPLPDTSLPKQFRDTFSVRIGGDVIVWPNHLNLRLGFFYQSSAYPENHNTFNLDFPYSKQFGIGTGIGWRTGKHLDINVAYMHIFQPDVTVEAGIVQQQGLPLSTGEEIGNTINGGQYYVNMNIFSISAEGHF